MAEQFGRPKEAAELPGYNGSQGEQGEDVQAQADKGGHGGVGGKVAGGMEAT